MVDIGGADLFGEQVVDLLEPIGGGIIVGRDLLQPLFAAELVGASAREHDMRAMVLDRAGQQDRVFRAADPGDRAGRQVAAVHDAAVELVGLVPGEDRALAGVEIGVIFHRDDGGGDRVHRAAAVVQDLRADGQRLVQRGPDFCILLGRDLVAFEGAGPAVDCDRPAVSFAFVFSLRHRCACPAKHGDRGKGGSDHQYAPFGIGLDANGRRRKPLLYQGISRPPWS